MRFERTYFNSIWHTDYKQLDDSRSIVSYMDDALRFITSYDIFDNAKACN